ncbi:hypothetical protein [Micromonospora sp. NPDC049679]|uniref:hypothetical protein n=1 Tax=Micromonospora sp. NPDC049679 TaxID=3155920 RepID=UPI0033E65AC0
MKEVLVGSACAIALALLAGCSAEQPAGPAPATRPLDPTAADLVARAGSYYADEQVLQDAEATLVHRCMTTRGFRRPPPAPAAPVSHDEEWRPDPAHRRTDGYGLARAGRGEPPDPYFVALAPAHQERYQRELVGDMARRATLDLPSGPQLSYPTTGCLAESRAQLYGDVMEATRVTSVTQDLHNTVYLAAQADPEYRRTLARWADCMKRRGHPYGSPQQARNALAAERRSAAPTAAQRHEVAVAVADAECAAEVALPGTFESLLRRHAELLPEAQRAELNRLATSRAAALRHARQVAQR